MYLYRAVDKQGNTVDFLLTKRRNKYAAHKFLCKAIRNNGCPTCINIDKSGVNKEAIRTYNKRCFKKINIRQCKYINNRVEADHRFIKWWSLLMLDFISFESATRTLTGIEISSNDQERSGSISYGNSLHNVLFSDSMSKVNF